MARWKGGANSEGKHAQRSASSSQTMHSCKQRKVIHDQCVLAQARTLSISLHGSGTLVRTRYSCEIFPTVSITRYLVKRLDSGACQVYGFVLCVYLLNEKVRFQNNEISCFDVRFHFLIENSFSKAPKDVP